MKRTEYYNSQEELNNYYPDGIPSTVLAIVKGEEGKSVLFTTSNNESATGTTQDQGGYNIDEDTQEKIEVSYEFATDTGASKTYVADYVSTYGGGEAPDMTAYVSKVELSNCGYITAQDVPAPDLSAYVSKTELSNASYIAANTSLPFGKYLGIGNLGKIEAGSNNLITITTGVQFQEWLNHTTHAYINCVNDNNIAFDGTSANNSRFSNKLFVEGELYAYGIGGFTSGTFNSSTMKPLSYVINDLQSQISNIPSGGEDNVQADWNESDSSSDAYIKNKPGDLVDQKMLDAVFSQNATRSEQYTYSGQVVDYISYLDFAHNTDLDNVVWFNNEEDFTDNGLTNIIDYNVDESGNGFLDTGTIVARNYGQDINNTSYPAAIGIGMVEYEDENENIQRVPAVIDTYWEVPDSGKKSPVIDPELKQTYKELATKEYVESLIGTALSLSEAIVGEDEK